MEQRPSTPETTVDEHPKLDMEMALDSIEKQLERARQEGFEQGYQKGLQESQGKGLTTALEEVGKINQFGKERSERISEFLTETLSTEKFLEKFPNAKVVWFGNFGHTKSEVEEPTGSYDMFAHAFIFNQRDADRCAEEIQESLRNNGWDKYYICADETLSNYLLSKVSVDEKLEPKAKPKDERPIY